MKYVLISLLILNVGYFAWQWTGKSGLPASVTSPLESPSAETIVLLREIGPPDRRDEDMAKVVNNPVRAVVGESQTCLAIGPFKDVFEGQDALEQLSGLGQNLNLRAIDVATGESDHRVLIPPAVSAEDAFRKLRELQASKIDSYVITQGEQAMGISLGVFSTTEAAIALQRRLQGMGYASEIVEMSRLSRSYWLFPSENGEIEAQSWLANRPELELRPMNCIES